MDGMDEISICSDSYLLRVENGKIFDEEIIVMSEDGKACLIIIAAIIPAVPEPTMPIEKLLLMRTKSPKSI
jgi:hypothetical protein